MLVILLQLKNATPPMLVTLDGITMLASLLQSKNVAYPMDVIPSGSVTLGPAAALSQFRRVCHSVKENCRIFGKLLQNQPIVCHCISDAVQISGMASLFIFVRFISKVECT